MTPNDKWTELDNMPDGTAGAVYLLRRRGGVAAHPALTRVDLVRDRESLCPRIIPYNAQPNSAVP